MIYLADPTQATDLYFPRTTEAAALVNSYHTIDTSLKLRHTTTQERRLEGGYVTITGDYFLAADFVDIDGLPAGEWEYELVAEIPSSATAPAQTIPLSSGILRVGELPAEAPIQYDKPIEYEQYND